MGWVVAVVAVVLDPAVAVGRIGETANQGQMRDVRVPLDRVEARNAGLVDISHDVPESALCGGLDTAGAQLLCLGLRLCIAF